MLSTKEFLQKSYKLESEMGALCYQWANHNYPQSRGLFFHIANEQGHNTAKGIAQLVSQGLVAGVPDYVNISPLFAIELKMPKGQISPRQRQIHELWAKHGIKTHVCYNLEQFYQVFVHHYGLPRD